MKNMMRSVLLSGALLVAALSTAQDGPRGKERTPEQRAAQRTEWMTKELSLTAEQSKKIEAIHLQHISKKQSIHSMEDKEQQKNAMREVRRSQQAAIQEVLTPEQQARFAELKAERKAQRQKPQGEGSGVGKKDGTPRKGVQEKR